MTRPSAKSSAPRSARFGINLRGRSATARQPSLDLTLTGFIYGSMMVFLILAAMNTQANLLFAVFGLMVGILLITGMVSRFTLKKLRLHRNLPKHAIAGEPLIVDYGIANEKRYWPSLSVNVSELDGMEGFVKPPQCYLLHAAPGVTAKVPVELYPLRRGVFEFNEFQLSTSFPFGFIKRATVARQKESICIFPALAEVDPQLLSVCRAADHIGQPVRPRGGGVDEFYGLREFRAGDNPRNIYWKRSARTGILVAKERMSVAPPRLQIIVDTHLPRPTRQAKADVERAIAMAGSIVACGLDQELAVGICAFSERVITIPPVRGKQHREELLTLLARLPDNTAVDARQLLKHVEWMIRQGTTLLLVTAGDERSILPPDYRGAVMVVSSTSLEAARRFRFRPGVNFDFPDEFYKNEQPANRIDSREKIAAGNG